MKNIIKKNVWFIVGLGIISWVVFVNLFPEGYVLVGEDTSQLINLKNSFAKIFFDWDGRASIFYSLFYLLDKIGISETGQISWYLGIFIFGSYFSFQAFARLLFKINKSSDLVFSLASLFYALNMYTLYVFTYSWGYSYYQSLYIFIPVIVGLYFKFLRTEKYIYGILFCLMLLLGSSGFGNPAFAISFAIFLVLATLILGFAGWFKIKKKLLIKLAVIGVLALIVNAYWILPVVFKMKAGISDMNSTNIIDLAWWLQHTSNPVLDTIRMMQFNGKYFFPINFPYKNFSELREIFVALTFLPILIIFFSFWQKRKSIVNYKIYWTFVGLFGVFILLTAKIRFPFEKINNLLFQLPIFSVLRGYEKFAIYTPFIMAVLLLFFLLNSSNKKYYKFAIIIFAFVLLTPAPFYVGKLQQNTSFILEKEKSKDYRKSEYSFLVKIPKEYYEIQNLINEDSEDFKIASLPYNVIGSIGWVNYPKWQLQGADITEQLYSKEIIGANNFYFGQWLYAKDFNELDLDPIWIAKLLGLMNVKYILYHKDVDSKFIKMSFEKIKFLENKKIIKGIAENDFFNLYELNDKYQVPYLSWESKKVIIEKSPLSVVAFSDELKKIAKKGDYKKITPKKITVNVNKNYPRYLSLNEKRDNSWQAYWVSNKEKKKKVRLKKVKIREYANSWIVKKNIGTGQIIIEYQPMKLFYIGAKVSACGAIIIMLYIMYYFYEKRKR